MLNQENNSQNQTGNPWDQINNSQAVGRTSVSQISQGAPQVEGKTEEKPKKQRLNPKDAKEEFDPQ